MNSNQHENWKPCEPGQLRDLADGMRNESRRQRNARRTWTALGGAGLTVALVIAVAYGGSLLGPGDQPGIQTMDFGPKGGLTCSKVVEIYDEYAGGRLDDEMTTRVSLHLDDCPHCRQRLGAGKSTHVEPEPRLDRDGELLITAAF